MPPGLLSPLVELRVFEPLTFSMPWAGVIRALYAAWRSMLLLQGARSSGCSALHLGSSGFTRGHLPNLSHLRPSRRWGIKRSGGRPAFVVPRLSPRPGVPRVTSPGGPAEPIPAHLGLSTSRY